MTRAIPAAALLAGLTLVAVANAEGPIALSWTAPPGCPTTTAVRAAIERQLGGAPKGKPLEARGRVWRQGDRFHLSLRMHDAAGEGQRELDASSCEDLADAGALIIALAHDPEAVAATQARAEPPGEGEAGEGREVPITIEPAPVVPLPTPPPPPAAPPPSPIAPLVRPPAFPPVPREEPDRVPWLRVALEPSVGFDLGSLPGPAFAVGGAATLRIHPWSVGLRGQYLLPRRQTLAGSTAGGELSLWEVGLSGCFSPWRSRRAALGRLGGVAAGLCLTFDGGQMRGKGYGVRNPDSGTAPWVKPAVGGRLALTLLPWLEVDLAAEVGFPLLRPPFVLRSVGTVHQAGVAVGQGRVGLGVVF
ncbi:MAG: hypothetical protein R3B72_20785 [Polyangiaceae bacterium]